MRKIGVWILCVLVSIFLVIFFGCDSDDVDDDGGGSGSTDNNKCSGSCTYCDYEPGMYCTGTTEDGNGDTWCWYCYDGQTCNPDTGHCE